MKFNKELIMQENTVVHCDTKEKAARLLEWADSLGRSWRYGDSYLYNTNWDNYKELTCYYIYNNSFADTKGVYTKYNYKILEFEEVLEMTEIIAGINKVYDLGEGIEVSWECEKAYKKEDDYSFLYMFKGENVFFEIRITASNIEEANKILALYNCKIVEKPNTITITADNGEKLEISVEDARKLGFKVEG